MVNSVSDTQEVSGFGRRSLLPQRTYHKEVTGFFQVCLTEQGPDRAQRFALGSHIAGSFKLDGDLANELGVR